MNKEEKTPRETGALLDHKYDGMLPVSLFCGLIGMLLGSLPAAIFALVSGKVFYPLFIATPFIICFLIKILKAGRDIRSAAVTAVFSLAGAYFTALSCGAALYVRLYGMAVYNIPLLTMLSIGKSGVIPASGSAYIYPLLFTIFGIITAWQLFISNQMATIESGDQLF